MFFREFEHEGNGISFSGIVEGDILSELNIPVYWFPVNFIMEGFCNNFAMDLCENSDEFLILFCSVSFTIFVVGFSSPGDDMALSLKVLKKEAVLFDIRFWSPFLLLLLSIVYKNNLLSSYKFKRGRGKSSMKNWKFLRKIFFTGFRRKH